MLPDKITPDNLPTMYESAKTALIECAEIDECKDWVDKAAAMEVYARQANDDSLLKMAMRIKLRASRKCGEYINAVPSGTGKSGDAPTLSKRETAESNGISKDQQITYQRIANVDEADFEQQVESDNPPTMTNLAKQGKDKERVKAHLTRTKDFPISWCGSMKRFLEQCALNEPEDISKCFYEQEDEVAANIDLAIEYLTTLKSVMEK